MKLPKIKPFQLRRGLIELHLCAGCGYIVGRSFLVMVPSSLGRASHEPIFFHNRKECRRAARTKLDALPARKRDDNE